jgi:hypothetical protein
VRISKIASTGIVCAALQYTPRVSALLVVLLVVSAVVFLRWFVRQPKPARADVIRLIRALRGK